MIEPILQRQSPGNGNFRGRNRRLWANWVQISQNWTSEDCPPNGKSPPLAGLSPGIGDPLSDGATAWLGREASNLRMPESKSACLFSDFKAHLEKTTKTPTSNFNSLAAVSK
jgi:hypothetical protein